MGVPASEVGYTPAMSRREDHEVHKGHVVALGGKKKKKIRITVCYTVGLRAGLLSRYSDWLRTGRSGDRIPVGGEIFAPVQTGPGAHPASCTMGTWSFPGGKERPGRDTDLSHPSSAVVKKE